MAEDITFPGRLIAVDGSRGKDTAAAANAIVDELGRAGVECAVSRWDASGLFGELAQAARGERSVSARTLALVYAADLAFRLRWEIRPVLEAGGIVIAAPYIETPVAFTAGCGLRDEWLRQLLRFAPAPDLRGRARERKVNQPLKRRTDRGYAEFGAAMLSDAEPKLASKAARNRMIAMLDQARGRKVFDLTAKGVSAMAAAITGSRRAASRRSASKPRTGRK
jgi:Thymidylate kinase